MARKIVAYVGTVTGSYRNFECNKVLNRLMCNLIQAIPSQPKIMTNGTAEQKHLFSWVKPAGPPKVWSLVDSIKKDEQGRSFKFTIQEISEDRYEEALDLMCTYFIREEPLCVACNGKDDPEYIAYYRELWANLLKQRLSIGAFIDNPDNDKPILAGVNIIGLCLKDNKDSIKLPKIRNKNAERVMGLIGDLIDQARVYEIYNVDRYLTSLGLCVKSCYQGEGLGGHILKAREKLGRAYELPITAAVFSSPVSLKHGVRNGYQQLLEKDYADIKDQEGNVLFPNIKVKSIIVLGQRLY